MACFASEPIAESWWKASFKHGQYQVQKVRVLIKNFHGSVAWGNYIYIGDNYCGMIPQDVPLGTWADVDCERNVNNEYQ